MQVKSQQPKGQADTSKNLAEQWKALPEAQKQKYNQAYQASMATYNASMEAYEKVRGRTVLVQRKHAGQVAGRRLCLKRLCPLDP